MKKLKNKILVRSISVTAAFLLLLTFFLAFMNYRNTLDTLEKTMKETAKVSALQVETRLGTSKSIMGEIGLLPMLSDDQIPPVEKKKVLDMKCETYELKLISMALSNGIDLNGNNIKDKNFFAESIEGQTYVADPIVSEDGTSAEFIISAPLWGNGEKGGKVAGVVYAVLDIEFLCNVVDNIKIGETGSAYIINADATCIAHKKRELVYTMNNAVIASQQDKSLEALAELETRANAGETVFGKYTFQNVTKFAVLAPISNTNGWVFVVNAAYDEYMKQTVNTIIFAIAITLFAIVTSAFSNIKLANSITKPILELNKAAESLSEGELDITILHQGNDELGKLALSFNSTIISLNSYIKDIARACSEISRGNFDLSPTADFKGAYIEIVTSIDVIIHNLSKTIKQICISSEQVNMGAEQVSGGAQALSQGAAEQASSIEELSASIAEVSEHIHKNAENARLANESAELASKEIIKSNEEMKHMMEAMNEINSKSSEISKIIKVIEDIAFQTNILALNAAVEAARAGTAGKGFAVVADEVRSLASKSADAAKSTTLLIEDAIAAVQTGTQIAYTTAKYLDESEKVTRQAVSLIEMITEASELQASATAQINVGIEQIATVVQTTSATAEESAAASEELKAQANMLQNLITQFKLKE